VLSGREWHNGGKGTHGRRGVAGGMTRTEAHGKGNDREEREGACAGVRKSISHTDKKQPITE